MGLPGIKRAAALGVAGVLISVPAWAGSEPPEPGDHREPPQAAFDICTGKSEGAEVAMTIPGGTTIKAICTKFKNRLAAVPEGAPPPPPCNCEKGPKDGGDRM